MNRPILNCKECNNDFTVKPYRLNTARFCSTSCGVTYNMRGNKINLGRKQTPEEIAKRAATNTGKKRSQETKDKIGNANRGHVMSQEQRTAISLRHKGRVWSESEKMKLRGRIPWNKGKTLDAVVGEKHWNWKGGKTPENLKIRKSAKYKTWRRHVFNRDNYTCQACGKRGGKLNADHVMPFSMYPDVRFEILNGQTLCVPCHKLTPSFSQGVKTLAKILQHE